jgi:hypothetical protein
MAAMRAGASGPRAVDVFDATRAGGLGFALRATIRFFAAGFFVFWVAAIAFPREFLEPHGTREFRNLRHRMRQMKRYTRVVAPRWFASGLLLFGTLDALAAGAQQANSAVTAEPQASFEVASIKPSRPDDQRHNWNSCGDSVSIENYTLRRLIRTAYGLKSDSQVLGGPE